mmetsp:Transcript_123630/g.219083  ORF Transcript_123630/g.219083 Transcript_123630/m.219083 type:complete len:645 (+) Transcript_123630:75-2009(+)
MAQSSLNASMRPFAVNTVACEGMAARELYSLVASELGCPECKTDTELDTAQQDTIYCVVRTRDLQERLQILGNSSWVTRYLSAPDLCEKSNLSKIVSRCSSVCCHATWDFFPRTWRLPAQHDIVRDMLQKGKHTYIVKPTDGSQGEGIFLVQDLADLSANMAGKSDQGFVLQKYLHPLLLDGFKFDLRMYVCLIGGSPASPPMAFLCREGLARFCTEVYQEPAAKNMQRAMAHPTNYSLNKDSSKFEHSGDTYEEVFDLGNVSSKRPLTVALRQIELQHPKFDTDEFYCAVARMAQNIVAVMSPVIVASHRPWTGDGDIHSLQVLGFDVMLDKDFRPHLLEVNNSPSLRIDEVSRAESEELRDVSFAEVVVEGAGTASVNSVFTEGCLKGTYCVRSFYSVDRKHGLHCTKAVVGCPAGWYITGPGERGMYYNPSVDPHLVPETGWKVYRGPCSSPGLSPPPRIAVVCLGLPPKTPSKLCFCSHDEMPHFHKESMVDVCVKRIAMAGAFQLVGQLHNGEVPSVEAYIYANAAQADFYPTIQAVEVLFHHCGGAPKCFESHVLQRALAPAYEQGQLTSPILEALIQKFRSTDFVSQQGAPNALRLYDFLALLVQVSIAAFPFLNTRDGLAQLLEITRPGDHQAESR